MTAPLPTQYRYENGLLLAAARADAPTEAQREGLPALNWEYLLTAADRQGVTALLAQWFQTHAYALVLSTDEQQATQTRYWKNHFRNVVLLRELARVRAAAGAAGIALLPLKGAALAPTYYPSPSLRPMSDLDLLARVGDFGRVPAVLTALGYVQTPSTPAFVAERLRQPWQRELQFTDTRGSLAVLVEVRAEPLDPAPTPIAELDAPLAARLAAYAARLWERATPPLQGGDDAPRIAPEDLLLHVASHMVTRHADFRLIWLLDLAHLLRRTPAFDWELLARETRNLGLAVPVATALEAATRWLDAPAAPAGLWRGSRHERRVFAPVARFADTTERRVLTRRIEAIAQADLTAPQPAPFWVAAAALTRMRGLAPRLRVLRWLLFPGGEYLAEWHGGSGELRGGSYARAAFARLGASAATGFRVASRRVQGIVRR